MKALVDTNIIIDALTGREPFRETAEKIFMLAANQVEISCCASRNQMDYIVTRNIKDYKESKIQAVLPDEFIQLISSEESPGI